VNGLPLFPPALCAHAWDTSKRSPSYNACGLCGLRLGEPDPTRFDPAVVAVTIADAERAGMAFEFVALLGAGLPVIVTSTHRTRSNTGAHEPRRMSATYARCSLRSSVEH